MRRTKVAPETAQERDDLSERLTETFARDALSPAACVADGFGVRVTVEWGRLVVRDGLGTHRRERRYSRAVHGLVRVVVIASTGAVSLEALRWCAGIGVGVVVLDPFNGELHLTSGGSGNNDPRLRRSQALAMGTETGLEVARSLVRAKLDAQASVAGERGGETSTARVIATLGEMVRDATSLEECRQLEAAAANAYFAAWSDLVVPFVRKDIPKIPEHWQRFDGRRSAPSGSTARNATDPLNALLNYGYRLLEAEGRLACLAMGLDPGLGVLHADAKGRDSLVLDVMEPVRPTVDAYVFDLLSDRPLRKADFAEDRRGIVRLLAPLTHRMAEAMPAFASALGPIVEQVATILASPNPYDLSVPSVLTRSKHRAVARKQSDSSGRPRIGPNTVRLAPRPMTRLPTERLVGALPPPICRGCGVPVPDDACHDGRPRRKWCDGCLGSRRTEIGNSLPALARERSKLVKATNGESPSHSTMAQERRVASNRRRELERLAWEASHPALAPDLDWFLEQIAPRLRDFSLTTIARALGVSTSMASKYRTGRNTPHVRHWQTLAELVGVNPPLPDECEPSLRPIDPPEAYRGKRSLWRPSDASH